MKAIPNDKSEGVLCRVGVLAALLFLSCASLAADSGCIEPDAPTLPAAIADTGEADRIRSQNDAYLDAARDYAQCLRDYANANRASLSDADLNEIRRAFEGFRNRVGSYTEQWNSRYASFIAADGNS